MFSQQIGQDRESILKSARAMAPELAARASEGETARTLPADLTERVRTTGLFNMLGPRSLGGLELDPATFVEVIEELSRADGSAGWTVLIGNSSAFLAWLDPDAARQLIGDAPRFAATAMFAPLGHATPRDRGYTIEGRWPFNSGSPHATISSVGVFVLDDDGRPRMIPGRGPDWRFVFFRREQAELLDTWDAAGLRGTGSHDLAVHGLQVPTEHVAAPLFEPACHDGPLWRLPLWSLATINFAGFPLGVARRALDEFTALAPTKTRGHIRHPIAQDSVAQLRLAQAEGGLQAARAFVFDALADIWDTACAGDVPDLPQRARLLLAVQQSMRAAIDAVDAVFPLAGAGAVYTQHPLQRCFRDLHTANQHIFFNTDAWTRCIAHRLQQPAPTHLI